MPTRSPASVDDDGRSSGSPRHEALHGSGRSGPLIGVRVVELGDYVLAPFASRLLADLGADVIKVELDSGDPSRHHGPFPDEIADPDQSGLFHALNAGKRGSRVDLATAEDRRRVLQLLADANIFITNLDTTSLDELGLAPAALRARFPHLVIACGSTFGSSTPHLATTTSTALHVAAATGFSSMIGHPGRMPLPLPIDLPDYVAGANLAAAALAAHFGVLQSGTGQIVDVAASEVFAYLGVVCATLIGLGADRVYRAGRSMPGSGGVYPFRFFPTADGAVAVACRSARDWTALLTLVGTPPWAQDGRWADPSVVARTMSDEADRRFEPWFAEHQSEELFARARELGLPLAPVRSIADLLAEPQFEMRQSLSEPIQVGSSSIRIMRAPARFSRTPVARRVAPAPSINTGDAIPAFDESGPAAHTRRTMSIRPGAGILDGIRVLDLSWVWSGPMTAATLGDLGAEVIKVESRNRLDNARLRGRPLRDGVPIDGPAEELSTYFHQNNRGKKSVELDLKQGAGRQAFRQLAATADIIIDNLSPGVFDKLGIGYDSVAETNDRVIWLAMSAAGKDGPLAGMRAYAPIMSAMAGIEGLVGYPDDPIVGMILAGIGDPNATSHALVAVLAALIERETSGRGQFIDFSQIEAMASDMCEPIAEFMITGNEPESLAAAHPRHSPHGHYPCSGDDAWVAIAVVDDESWRRLAAGIGKPELATSDRFSTTAGRVTHRDELDLIVSQWTSLHPIDRVVDIVSSAGVVAVPVADLADAQRTFAALRTTCDHPITGPESLACVPWHYSETPPRVITSAPLVGQHTDEILASPTDAQRQSADRATTAAPT